MENDQKKPDLQDVAIDLSKNPVSAIRIHSLDDDGATERAQENPAKKAEDTIEEK